MATQEPVVSVASLGNPVKAGFLTKQGGSVKTWKKRWFVLKGDTLWYFKTQKDQEQTGYIKFESNSVCQMEASKNKKNCYFFSVGTSRRTFLMYADAEQQAKEWVDHINKALKEMKGGKATAGGGGGMKDDAMMKDNNMMKKDDDMMKKDGNMMKQDDNMMMKKEDTMMKKDDNTMMMKDDMAKKDDNMMMMKKDDMMGGDGGGTKDKTGKPEVSPRQLINLAKGVVHFLQDEESKVLEFWQIWSESLPPTEDLLQGMAIEFSVSTSANMQKLTWRTAGPQNVFIQKMVDFFWNVGAPESEIDRLNDVGALINPLKIGSWIDMSGKGGMDGGWYFPVDIPTKMAVEASDPGDPSKKFTEWAEKHSVDKCFSVGRDMGAAPPRQTELRLKLPGSDFSSQLNVALDAFTMFGFPALPENALAVLHEHKPNGLCLSVITSSEGFVRLGLMAPKPNTDTVLKLCTIAGANNQELAAFEGSLGAEGPSFVEYQYLMQGFGYGVYKEGFDIVFHYNVGEETNDA